MKFTPKAPRAAIVLLLAAFLSTTLVGAAGCWFSPGKEGFVCKSSSDCNKGLRCRTYQSKGKNRRQCRPYSKRTISSKSGYTVYAIYMSYGFWILLPPGIIFAVFWTRRKNRKEGDKQAGADQPGGGDQPGSDQPSS